MKSIQETRRARTRQIIEENFGRSSTAFAAALKYASPNFVSRLISESPKNQKPIGTRLARKIEAVAGRPKNFLDTPISVEPQSIRIGGKEVQLEPLESQLIVLFRSMSRDSQEALIGRAQALFLAEHKERSAANPFPLAVDTSELAWSLNAGREKSPKQSVRKPILERRK